MLLAHIHRANTSLIVNRLRHSQHKIQLEFSRSLHRATKRKEPKYDIFSLSRMDPSPGQSTSRRPPQYKKPSNSRPPVQKPSGKLRGHPKDAEDVRISKTLSWLLRHGAKSEGLSMRADGYVKVVDLVSGQVEKSETGD